MQPAQILVLLLPLFGARQVRTSRPALEVSSQGLFLEDTAVVRSADGTRQLRLVPVAGDEHVLWFDLEILQNGRVMRRIERVRGSAFVLTNAGHVVAIDTWESTSVPNLLEVYDETGRSLWSERVLGLHDPVLSSDGSHLLYGTAEGTTALDLETLVSKHYGRFEVYSGGPKGSVVGWRSFDRTLTLADGNGLQRSIAYDGEVRRLALSPRNGELWVLDRRALHRFDVASGARTAWFTAPEGTQFRDLRVVGTSLAIGARRVESGRSTGSQFFLESDGRVWSPGAPPSTELPRGPEGPDWLGKVPWPLQPQVQHPIGNSYGEFQDYGSNYLHPGIDVMGSDYQPVFAVRGGVVKAVLTTSGSYHWRVAIGDQGSSGTSKGYLYAHLDLPTIAVDVGDTVVAGQYLGDLVPWPVAGFTHTHFARIEDTGTQWSGSWLCTGNPQLNLWPQVDSEGPVFENAVGSDLFAFCIDQTATYLNPDALAGRVDIVAHVGDRIESTWVCAVQSIRYTIHPRGDPQRPLVHDKLAVCFDMPLDTYQNGPFDPFLVQLLYKEDSTCNTNGDYNSREFFHILTNSNGDRVYEDLDLTEAWDTTLVPDGDYVVSATAFDVAGNHSTAKMIVTVDNGRP